MALTLGRLIPILGSRGLEVPEHGPLVGLGWGTVDLDRAAIELATEAGLDGSLVRPAPEDAALGASARRLDLADGPLFLLEPRTEGRLAAALARHGEGPVAIYLAAADAVRDAGGAGSAGVAGRLLAPQGDPLGGWSRLLPPEDAWGPFVLYHQPMTTEPTIRPATDADAEAIATLFTDEGYPAGPSDIRERLSRFDSDFSTVRVAELGGDVVGFVAVHVMPRFEHGDRIARILALIVDAGVRERGIGHILMSTAEEVARETGCAFIEITAGRHRPEAQHLYEAVGYETGIANYLRKRL
ncbi:MAG: GNAT family N-acetyltransferase [Candidatus Limnocylindrales bacterium]